MADVLDGEVVLLHHPPAEGARALPIEREFFIDNLLVRIHFIIVIFRWTGLAPWEFEFPFPGSLTTSFLPVERRKVAHPPPDQGSWWV